MLISHVIQSIGQQHHQVTSMRYVIL